MQRPTTNLDCNSMRRANEPRAQEALGANTNKRVSHMMIGRWLSTVLLACAFAAGATSVSVASSDNITVGFATAFTGWISAIDLEGTNMAKLWIEQMNAKGGLLGRQLKAIEADTKTDRVESAKAGQ